MQTLVGPRIGNPSWVNARSSARFRLGPDPRIALGPAVISAAPTGRTRDRTRPTLRQRHKALAKAPSTRDPKQTLVVARFGVRESSLQRFHEPWRMRAVSRSTLGIKRTGPGPELPSVPSRWD